MGAPHRLDAPPTPLFLPPRGSGEGCVCPGAAPARPRWPAWCAGRSLQAVWELGTRVKAMPGRWVRRPPRQAPALSGGELRSAGPLPAAARAGSAAAGARARRQWVRWQGAFTRCPAPPGPVPLPLRRPAMLPPPSAEAPAAAGGTRRAGAVPPSGAVAPRDFGERRRGPRKGRVRGRRNRKRRPPARGGCPRPALGSCLSFSRHGCLTAVFRYLSVEQRTSRVRVVASAARPGPPGLGSSGLFSSSSWFLEVKTSSEL